MPALGGEESPHSAAWQKKDADTQLSMERLSKMLAAKPAHQHFFSPNRNKNMKKMFEASAASRVQRFAHYGDNSPPSENVVQPQRLFVPR